jgi:uncharacterized protein (TIRG00374 family)
VAVSDQAANEFDVTNEMDRDALPTGELPEIPRSGDESRWRGSTPIRIGLRVLLFALILYFLLPLLPRFREAAEKIQQVDPLLIVLGFALQLAALFAYSLLTRATLGEAAKPLSKMRMFRIQLSTKALTNVVPGGNAAGSALGYRLLTLSGVRGPDAGFALATAGIGSAVVLNVIFWFGLIISVPRRGVNPYYGSAALAGIIVICITAFLVIGLMDGQQRAVRATRWIATKLRLDPDKFEATMEQVAFRVEALTKDRPLLRKVVFFALLNWMLDAASLWVFIRAFGETLELDALLVAFGLANLLAAIPLTPGGLGYVDGAYVFTLVGFGIPQRVARVGVATYRFAQFFFPILLGAIAYLSLRVGPWRIEKRDRLVGLRTLARTESARGESRTDFILRFPGQREIAEEAEVLTSLDANADDADDPDAHADDPDAEDRDDRSDEHDPAHTPSTGEADDRRATGD